MVLMIQISIGREREREKGALLDGYWIDGLVLDGLVLLYCWWRGVARRTVRAEREGIRKIERVTGMAECTSAGYPIK